MNRNFIILFGLFIVFLLFFGCSKEKKNTKLAQTYYKLSLLELGEDVRGENAYKRALNVIDKAIEQECRPEYLALKATILFKLGKDKQGDEFFSRALEAKPSLAIKSEILNNKACLLAQMGIENNDAQKIQQALNIWQMLEGDKDYLTPEVALFNQSKAYIFQKNNEKAKEKLIKAINVSPNYMDAHYYLASIAYNLNDFELAKNEVGTVLFLEPSHEGAKQLSLILQKK